jgi:hypothetical protein
MQVNDGEITSPSSEMPGYVLTGGTTAGGSEWTIEVSPSSRNVDMHYSEVGGSGGGGAADFTVPDVPIEASTGHPVVFGAVTFEADRVEVRPSDGSDPIPGSILQLPDSLNAPFDAFVAPNSPDGEIVAIGPDGVLGRTATIAVGPEPAPTVEDVQSDLRNAYVAAKTYYTDGNTFEGFDPQVARSFGTSLRFNEAAQAISGEVSIRDVAADHILFAEATARGEVLCIAENDAGRTTYGALDAQTTAECVGGEAAWGQSPAPSSGAAQVIVPDVPGGNSWTLQFESGEIVLRDGDQVLTGMGTTPDGVMSAVSYVFGNGVDAEAVIFGVTDPSVSAVVVESMGSEFAKTDDTLLPGGRSVFWWSGPGSLGTRVTAVGDQCDGLKSYVLGRAGLEPSTGGAVSYACAQVGGP